MTARNQTLLKEIQGEPAVDSEIEAPRLLADDIAQRTERVAAVAALHAEDVDRNGRFPLEAITAAKALGLMGLMAPTSLGGEAVSLSQIANICYALGRACASTGMIYAMHQVKVACVVRHGIESDWHRDFMARMVEHQFL